MSMEYKKLIDLTLNKPQYGSGSKAVPYNKESVRYVRITDIDDNGFLKKENITSPEKVEDKYLLEENDLLFARSGTVGKTYLYNKEDGLCQYAGYLIRFKINTKMVLPKYLYFFTKTKMYWNWVEKQKNTVTISNINAKKYSKLLIPILPIDKQKEIVEKLEQIMELINKKEKSIYLIEKYQKSIFYELIGNISENSKKWDLYLLDDIVTFETKSIKPIDAPDNLIYVGLENIKTNTGEMINLQYNKDVDLKSNKYLFNENMVLYGKLRPYLNKIALPTCDGLCSTDIIPLMPNEKCNKTYLKYVLSHEYYVKLATLRSTGANLPRIKPKTLKKFKIPLPPLKNQLKFEKIIIETELIKQKQIDTKKYLNNLFELYLEKYMNGENYA